jgi:hypothetical protein
VYCAHHEDLYGGLCHAANCINIKVPDTQACEQHQGEWRRHMVNQKQQGLSGYRRALRRPDTTLPWTPQVRVEVQPHDEDERPSRARHHFTPGRVYCVETICAPCGVVIAWAKFVKSEFPTNILNFLASVYPTEGDRPDYVCIDKACLVLRTCVANGTWDEWKKTTRFIVDTYHYSNHQATDLLCRTWCNPAPTDGSAPNLVVAAQGPGGQPYYKRAFNTQACEQLNAWLGGFEAILKRMNPGNFDWFLHTMLFYHTKHVLKRQKEKEQGLEYEEEVEHDDGFD